MDEEPGGKGTWKGEGESFDSKELMNPAHLGACVKTCVMLARVEAGISGWTAVAALLTADFQEMWVTLAK